MAKDESIEGEIVSEKNNKTTTKKGRGGGLFWGLVLVIVGSILFAEEVLGIEVWDNFWPLIIVFIGLFITVSSLRK